VATLRLAAAAATPPRRTDVQRLAGNMLVSAREVGSRVDGSEVDDGNSTLGANIVTAGEGDRGEEWEVVSCPASPAESSPARLALLRYGSRLTTVAQIFFFYDASGTIGNARTSREAEESPDAEVRRNFTRPFTSLKP
jgi:hypothetical protein